MVFAAGSLTRLSQIVLRAPVSAAAPTVRRFASFVPVAASADSANKVSVVNGIPMLRLAIGAHPVTAFTLVPGTTIGSLAKNIADELGAKDPIQVALADGTPFSSSSDVRILTKTPFKVVSGQRQADISVSEATTAAALHSDKLNPELASAIKRMQHVLDVDKEIEDKKIELATTIGNISSELAPLQKVKDELDVKAAAHTNRLAWFGLAAMSFQFGVLAQLTWFEYSWDIVEPITYFVTYSAVIGAYAYYVLTKSNYEFTGVQERKWLQFLHSQGPKRGLDIQRYNHLRDSLAAAEAKLAQLKTIHSD
ncbi:coiled-coil domain-containing protein [Capsaspora owczarzaki ATCC 30864]|uniref:Coiled-coil domain-containing protein n=1 Tax=Capsaspora owczarzaki (strain ATCC 30864) TaxID=595528 RepID=A0A0D2WKY6_CAPO3|nr:coiled-coil domain-containing protein [Capsaspora owczarzaki ATCC 30864]KJE90398.1 coiled-coil domain-containing protein [Capsaspora owczarzaki ATCC 30864]|eukprot:XP_004364582.2 coiled-coil domain-containing protein [Capsaspora owczarzaki ATCC 30864]